MKNSIEVMTAPMEPMGVRFTEQGLQVVAAFEMAKSGSIVTVRMKMTQMKNRSWDISTMTTNTKLWQMPLMNIWTLQNLTN